MKTPNHKRLWKLDWLTAAGLAFWLVLGCWFFLHTIAWRADGWYLGHGNVWSDWSLHISQVTRFAYTAPTNWWTSTYYAGAKFTYPFLSNLLSAGLVRLGWSYPVAMIGPSLVFWVATLAVLQGFGAWFLRSQRQSVLAISLFFCSAGLGILRVFSEPDWLAALTAPQRDYTQFVQYQWGTGNLFLGMFLPQRAFLFGFWVALLAFLLWVKVVEGETLSKKVDSKSLIFTFFAAVLAGLLPIIHMHSFMVLVMLCAGTAWTALRKNWQATVLFASVSGAIAIPLYLIFVSGGIQTNEFFQWRPGWTATGVLDWINQWLWQWGAMLPLGAVATWRLRRPLGTFRWNILLSFWGVFVVANLIQFQPVAWDNTKLFLWVYWGLSLSVAGLLASWWNSPGIWKKVAVLLLALVLTGTGAFELWRSSHLDRYTYQATSAEAYELALQIRQKTAPDAVFATAPVHNHWVTMWAGRSLVMGYSTWVWNFGYPIEPRQTDLDEMYQHPERRTELFNQYGVDFVVVGPEEQYMFGATDWSGYEVFAQTPSWAVYRVSENSNN